MQEACSHVSNVCPLLPALAADYLLRVHEAMPWFTDRFPPKVHTWDQSIFEDMVNSAASGHLLPLQMLGAHLANMAQGEKAFIAAIDKRRENIKITTPAVPCPEAWFPVSGVAGRRFCCAALAAAPLLPNRHLVLCSALDSMNFQ